MAVQVTRSPIDEDNPALGERTSVTNGATVTMTPPWQEDRYNTNSASTSVSAPEKEKLDSLFFTENSERIQGKSTDNSSRFRIDDPAKIKEMAANLGIPEADIASISYQTSPSGIKSMSVNYQEGVAPEQIARDNTAMMGRLENKGVLAAGTTFEATLNEKARGALDQSPVQVNLAGPDEHVRVKDIAFNGSQNTTGQAFRLEPVGDGATRITFGHDYEERDSATGEYTGKVRHSATADEQKAAQELAKRLGVKLAESQYSFRVDQPAQSVAEKLAATGVIDPSINQALAQEKLLPAEPQGAAPGHEATEAPRVSGEPHPVEPHVARGGIVGTLAVAGIVAVGALAKGASPANAATEGLKAGADAVLPGASDGFQGIRSGDPMAIAHTVTGAAANIPGATGYAVAADNVLTAGQQVLNGNIDGAARSTVTGVGIFAATMEGGAMGFEAGGPYGALLGAAASGYAATQGVDLMSKMGQRIELTPEQKAFNAFYDGLPAKPDASMSPGMRQLVEAKAQIVAGEATLAAAQRAPMESNPGVARNTLEGSENRFTQMFDQMRANGTLQPVLAELNARNHPQPAQTNSGTPIASMDGYQGRGQNRRALNSAANANLATDPTNPQDLRRVAAAGRHPYGSMDNGATAGDDTPDVQVTPVVAAQNTAASTQRRPGVSPGMTPPGPG